MNRFKKIGVVVLLVHCALLLLLMGDHLLSRKKPHKKIAVRTFSPPKPVATARSITPSLPKPKKKATPTPQIKPKQQQTAAKPLPKKTPALQSPNWVEEISKSLDAMASPAAAKPRPELILPSYLPIQAECEATSNQEAPLGDILIAFLESALKLPEYGNVVVKLRIDASGHLISCDILNALSKKNGEFLKKRLPELCFPCFNKNTEFTVTFRNVENL